MVEAKVKNTRRNRVYQFIKDNPSTIYQRILDAEHEYQFTDVKGLKRYFKDQMIRYNYYRLNESNAKFKSDNEAAYQAYKARYDEIVKTGKVPADYKLTPHLDYHGIGMNIWHALQELIALELITRNTATKQYYINN